jgi:hypothetical protein
MPLFAATAPDSISGKVYHEIFDNITARTITEDTIVFGEDGHFTFLKSAVGGPLVVGAPNKVFLRALPGDGTYRYQRADDTTAVLELSFDSGAKQTRTLTFNSATGGGVPVATTNAPISFYLTDLRAMLTAPAVNIAMRGRVSAGRPLIVGFVVPGTPPSDSGDSMPPPGARLQEVLIRAVGPSLSRFGVTETWADPDFQLFKGTEPARVNEAHYGDWGAPAESRKIFDFVGAFPLVAGSRDAADVVRLSPGAYTIVCNAAAGDPGGDVLIEVYFLP